MSTTTEVIQARGRRVPFPAIVAIAVSLTVGAIGGSVVTRAVDGMSRDRAAEAASGWDTQKLEAMRGRELAAAIATRPVTLWDPQKLAAMQGRQQAEAIRMAGG